MHNAIMIARRAADNSGGKMTNISVLVQRAGSTATYASSTMARASTPH
jgi:hypothetical protein